LTWTHWRLVRRVENADARDYYIRETAEQGWSSRQLERVINTQTFQRLLKTPSTETEKRSPRPHEFISDPYVLGFLRLPENPPYTWRDIESALTTRLRDFLMEMGEGFSFVGRKFRVSTETSHFYVDLVFYKYLLKCFVLLDLKTKNSPTLTSVRWTCMSVLSMT
jgi:predicted nuclease of restriction endonuclease-like (RecB) superfamily